MTRVSVSCGQASATAMHTGFASAASKRLTTRVSAGGKALPSPNSASILYYLADRTGGEKREREGMGGASGVGRGRRGAEGGNRHIDSNLQHFPFELTELVHFEVQFSLK